jgi:glyceraldehyde-3-phosphate dehydrogenase (NAD(P))
MQDCKSILIIGTGTIGEPLITLFARLKEHLGINEVYFHKHTPLLSDKTKVVELLKLGANLCVTSKKKAKEFEAIGLKPECMINEALNRAMVVIDCTPSGIGISNKEQFYEIFTHNTRGFIAQGSETGFGKPYAYQINDSAIESDDQFIQIVSCNTHNMACLLKTLAFDGEKSILSRGNFVCVRRATDISQYTDYIAAPTVGRHKDQRFGTHHAKDVNKLFATFNNLDLNVFSSVIKIPTQYMHIVQFRIKITRKMSLEEATERIKNNPLIATTEKLDTGTVFSFARDHSPVCGRILNQAIIPLSTLHIEGRQIMGYSFTSQDGNSLLSSVVAAERFLYPDSYTEKIRCLNALVFDEV